MQEQHKYSCNKCGSHNIGIRQNAKFNAHTDVYCKDCGAWIKFASKDDKRLLGN